MDKTRIKAMLLAACSASVSILLLGYAAYGWMSMTRGVKATAMRVDVMVPNNLEIATAPDGEFASTISVDLNKLIAKQTLGTAHVFDADTNTFYLLPASSYEGVTVWQTGRADSTGAALCEENEFLRGTPVGYSTSTALFEGYYIDVPLYLRTAAPEGCEIYLNEERTEVLAVGEHAGIAKVVRAAFLNEDKTGISNGGTAPLVFAGDGAYLGGRRIVTANAGNTASAYHEAQYMTFDDGVSTDLVAEIAPLSSGESYGYVAVTLRIWIEGQDSACVADIGGEAFILQVGFSGKDSV